MLRNRSCPAVSQIWATNMHASSVGVSDLTSHCALCGGNAQNASRGSGSLWLEADKELGYSHSKVSNATGVGICMWSVAPPTANVRGMFSDGHFVSCCWLPSCTKQPFHHIDFVVVCCIWRNRSFRFWPIWGNCTFPDHVQGPNDEWSNSNGLFARLYGPWR